MAWIDDIQARIEQSGDKVFNNIYSYLENRVTDEVVKIAEPQKGNLTAAQLAQGQTGGPKPMAAPAGGNTQNSVQASQLSQNFQKYLIPVGLALAVGFLFFSKKSRG